MAELMMMVAGAVVVVSVKLLLSPSGDGTCVAILPKRQTDVRANELLPSHLADRGDKAGIFFDPSYRLLPKLLCPLHRRMSFERFSTKKWVVRKKKAFLIVS